jgi:hypothetical protein
MIRLVVGATALLLGEVDLAQPGNEYFPLKQKTKWTYKVLDQTVEVVVNGTEKFNNEECTKVDTLVNGKVVASELYSVKPDGVYRVPAKKDFEWEIKSKVGNQSVSGKFKVKDISEKVTTPGGTTYEAVLVEGNDMEIAGTKTTVKTWYAKGVGVVKLEFKIQDAVSTLELTKFEEGK